MTEEEKQEYLANAKGHHGYDAGNEGSPSQLNEVADSHKRMLVQEVSRPRDGHGCFGYGQVGFQQ